MKMNRRQLFVSTVKAALATAFGGSWLMGKATAKTGGAASSASAEGVIHKACLVHPAPPRPLTEGNSRPSRRPSAAKSISTPASPSPGGRRASCRQNRAQHPADHDRQRRLRARANFSHPKRGGVRVVQPCDCETYTSASRPFTAATPDFRLKSQPRIGSRAQILIPNPTLNERTALVTD